MSLMDAFVALLLALFLTVPVGPVGFVAGERMMRGFVRDFRHIAVGCVLATMGVALAALMMMRYLPEISPAWFDKQWWLWLVMGGILMMLGVYLWQHLPKRSRGRKERRCAFCFGFGVTLLWPTSFPGMLGVLVAFQIAGFLPESDDVRLMLVPVLGVGSAVLWLSWGWVCEKLRAHGRWTADHMAVVFHRAMAASLVLGGMVMVFKPLGF